MLTCSSPPSNPLRVCDVMQPQYKFIYLAVSTHIQTLQARSRVVSDSEGVVTCGGEGVDEWGGVGVRVCMSGGEWGDVWG